MGIKPKRLIWQIFIRLIEHYKSKIQKDFAKKASLEKKNQAFLLNKLVVLQC